MMRSTANDCARSNSWNCGVRHTSLPGGAADGNTLLERVVVASIQSLMQLVPQRQAVAECTRRLATGDVVDGEELRGVARRQSIPRHDRRPVARRVRGARRHRGCVRRRLGRPGPHRTVGRSDRIDSPFRPGFATQCRIVARDRDHRAASRSRPHGAADGLPDARHLGAAGRARTDAGGSRTLFRASGIDAGVRQPRRRHAGTVAVPVGHGGLDRSGRTGSHLPLADRVRAAVQW